MGDAPASGILTRQAVAEKRPEAIAGMFDAIARRYDVLNHLLSGGVDWYWRWKAVRALGPPPGGTVLDLCTGTGDLAIETLRRSPAGRVVGLDFAAQMLRISQTKLDRRRLAARAPLIRGDASRLPVASASVDAVTIAFGIRNVQHPAAACHEMARVLKPGGRVAVLEFSMPRLPLVRQAYQAYFRFVLPRLGGLISRHDEAYAYLPASVGAFFSPEEFAGLLADAGFRDIAARPLTLGIVQLYLATRA